MSLEAYFRATAVVKALRDRRPDGVLDICPANASYQVRFDPDRLEPERLEALAREIEAEVGDARDLQLETRIVEIPVLYNDPWTHETLMRFRDRHQDPDGTDLEYAARINGFDDVQGFIDAHAGAPWLASMVGFVAGLPFLYQMVGRERQLQVPKYIRPRTDTPALTVGHGGCFGCIYSVRGAGGYQMFGITPAPIYDPGQASPTSRTSSASSSPATSSSSSRSSASATTRCEPRRRRAASASGSARSRSTSRSSPPTPTATTPGCWRCSMPIEVAQARPVDHRPGWWSRGLLPRGRAALRRARPVLARRGEPARRQPAGRRGAREPVHGPRAAVHRARARRGHRRRARARGSTARGARAGPRSPSTPATCCRSATSRRERGCTSRSPAASTSPRCSAAAPRTGSARSADSRDARCGPATSCRSARPPTARRLAVPCPRPSGPTCPASSRCAW